MITIRCDKCEKPLSVEDSLAGSKIACPHCGDINVVPSQASPGSASTPDRAAAAGFPPDSGPEQRVRLIRPAVVRAHPFTMLGLWSLLLLSLIGLVYLGLVKNSTAWGVASAVVLVIVLIVMAVWKLVSLAETLEITNKRSILRRGIFSRSTTEVVHNDIRNFQISQTFIQRILRVGTIGISSAGQDAVEIVMHDAARPDEVRRIIDLYRPI